jgi:hypothetical protein
MILFSRMKTKSSLMIALLAVIFMLLISAPQARIAFSQEQQRHTELVVSVTEYEWWVIRWEDNQILCRLLIDHEGLPTGPEIRRSCGAAVYDVWLATPPCPLSAQGTSDCPGVYMHQVSSRPAERVIPIELPKPSVWITLSGCTPTPPDNRCSIIPTLLLEGEEPLPNERITAIHARMNGQVFYCESDTCEIPLRPTPLAGATLEFWAESSFGDESDRYTALIRVIDIGVPDIPGGGGWYVDVISSQWRGPALASCAQSWQAFPPLGTPPEWLTTPEFPELLATDEPYQFLAGRLITRGVVDASDCPQGGVMSNGYATTCGLERARPIVLEWQNQFDARIIEVALETGVPAQLIKNLFAQESQFWPGVFNGLDHMGLGHITEKGADALLLWNRSFFDQFCPLVLHESTCSRGYLALGEDEQALLRGAVAMQAKAECPECPAGIDLTHANFTVEIFAQTLLANCKQVGQVVQNASNRTPGAVAAYEDLWKFTLANYHAGPGCLSYAVHTTWSRGERLTWPNVASYLTPACQGVISYVDNITRASGP